MSELTFRMSSFATLAVLLLPGCVSQQKYDALQARYEQLNQTMSSQISANQMHIDMISQGVKPSLLSAQGFGDADPVASNDTPEGQAQNRRVELTFAGSGN